MKTAIGAILIIGLAACGGTTTVIVTKPAPTSHPAPTATASSYPDVESLIAAMAVHGAVCSGVTFPSGDAVPGSLPPLADCSGGSQGDTSISVFDNNADALAYAHDMINVAANGGLGPAAEVVGPNWTVNTSPAFAAKVIKAVGGQLVTS